MRASVLRFYLDPSAVASVCAYAIGVVGCAVLSPVCIGPHTDAVYLRKSEWEEFEHDLHAYRAAEQAEAERKRAGAPTSLSSAEDERILEVCGCRLMTCSAHSRILF